MAGLKELREKIHEYAYKYRKENLEPLREIGAYSLNRNVDILGVNPEYAWPEDYPTGSDHGVYAFFNHEELLYIGKASLRSISARMGGHLKHGKGKKYADIKGNWSKVPTHFIVWCVPKEMFFEASALEEFLIDELKDELPDNIVGK